MRGPHVQRGRLGGRSAPDQLTRIGALDGIRGLALVAVLGYHVGPGVASGGFLGVEIFFVLSGYLLTALLLAEHARNGRIDHRRYATRRIRRLVPAAVILLATVLLLAPLVAPDDAHRLRGDLLSSLAGVTNWHLIADGSSYFATAGRPPLVRHLWSLAVEIQFCLVCSLIAAWLAHRSRRIAVVALGAGMSAAAIAMAVAYHSPDPSRAYYGTDTRLGALLAGVLCAVVLTGRPADRLKAVAQRVAIPSAVLLLLLIVLADQTARWMYPAGFLATQAATLVLIVAAVGEGRATDVLGTRSLRWAGERSYGIYLWHWPLVVLLRPGADVSWHPLVAAIVTTGVATILGALSFRFVEAPVLRGHPERDMWTTVTTKLPAHARVTAAAAAFTLVAAFAGLAVRLPTVDPIEESLRAGEEVIAAQIVPTASPAPAATQAPPVGASGARLAAARPAAPAPVPAPAPALGTFRPGSISVTAMGDSVMVGGAKALHDRLGSSGYIDAAKNRRFSEAATIARTLREQGRLGRIVIVHLGNNGPVTDGEVEAFLHEVNGVQNVLLVTVRVSKPWEGSVNETLRAAEQRHKTTIRLVDWHAYSGGHPDWFYSDGTHLTKPGAENYAKLLTGSIPPPPKPKPKPKPTPEPTPTPAPLPVPTLLPPRA